MARLDISSEPPPSLSYEQLGPDEVEMLSTPLTRGQANFAIREAFTALEDREPTDNELHMLSAHSGLETGNWGTGLHNYNFGNFTGSPYFTQLVPELIDGEWKQVDQKFKSFELANEGAIAWLNSLKRNWPTAFAILDSGDTYEYSRRLKEEGRLGVYYTQTLPKYADALASRYTGEGGDSDPKGPEAGVSPSPEFLLSLYGGQHDLRTLIVGDNGLLVSLWQTIVEVKIIDGRFGPITRQYTQDWQNKNSIMADGVVGPTTWSILIAEHLDELNSE